tara:strand:+ start:682 stop:939 length:258 start_codon:yes stop_codon:yes gene_type:complete
MNSCELCAPPTEGLSPSSHYEIQSYWLGKWYNDIDRDFLPINLFSKYSAAIAEAVRVHGEWGEEEHLPLRVRPFPWRTSLRGDDD